MSSVLSQICEAKRAHIVQCKQETPFSALEARAKITPPPRGFLRALHHKMSSPRTRGSAGEASQDSRLHGNNSQLSPALIAEIKRASPSKGLIRSDFHPAEIAKAYAKGGAACLSVLTDAPYFQGNNDFLVQAHEACTLPVLRKDFMLDTYQVTEARAIGADCILLIMAALEDALAQDLEAAALHYGMDVLIEVHDETELARALQHLKSRLIGINNRNLKTLEVNLETSKRLRPLMPEDTTAVCESGIKTYADIAAMQSHNLHCFLVGESLMLQRNIEHATHELLGNAIT